jgi:hypothetical protein
MADEVSNIPDQSVNSGANPNTQQQAQQDQVAQPTQATNQPSQPNPAQAQVNPSNQAATAQPKVPISQPQVKPNPQQSAYRGILEMLGGGPVKFNHTDPETGKITQVIEHRPAKAVGMGILSAALAGMFAGQSAPGGRNPATGGLDLSGAAQAGAAVGQAAAQKPSQQAQQRDDKAYASQINTTDHNLKVHQMMLANTQQQGSIMQSSIDDAEPIINSLEIAQKDVPQQLIKKQGVTEDELNKMLQDKSAHVTRDSVLPDGMADVYDENGKQVMNPDGTPKKTFTYTVYDHNGMVNLTDELRKANPELVSAAPGQQLPVKALAKLWRQRGESSAAQGYVSDFQKRLKNMTGNDQEPIDLKDAIDKDPILAGIKPILGRYAGMDPDKALEKMQSDKVDPNVIGSFQRLLGINTGDLAESRASLEREQRKQQDIETQKRLSEVTLQREKDLADYKKKLGITSDNESVSNAKSFPHEWVDDKSGMHYDLSDPVMNMVEGNEDPTQMTKRSKSYNQDLKMANAYSFARYGKPFDLAQAQSDYKYATAVPTQNTLKLLQSLTGEGNKNNSGTFKQLEDKFNDLGNTQIPKVNDIFNWLSTNSGQPGVPAFDATLLGVADEYGKILGGGVATDSSRNEAKAIISKAFSEQQGKAALNAIRGTLANRQNAMVGQNRYLAKQYGKMDQPGQTQTQTQTQQTPDHKQQILQSITMPGGGHPVDVKFGPNGSMIVWSGKAGDAWVNPATGAPVK